MSTEVWFRNPAGYVKELVECGQHWITWDRGYLKKRGVDPIAHASLYFGSAYPWRVIAVGPQGSAEYAYGTTENNPVAVYPTWSYGEDADILREMIEKPIGQDWDSCHDKTIKGDERPVWGQEHRVVIINMPPASTGPGKSFLRFLKELQEDYPACIVHLHGVYGWRTAFGLGFGAADVEPRTSAQKGKVCFPSGQERPYEQAQRHPEWVTSLGFKPVDLAVPRNRCMYNIKSAVWAGENYRIVFNFRTRNDAGRPDTSTPQGQYSPPVTKSPFIGTVIAKPGDKFMCDTCSLADRCKAYRAGAVCSLPDSESKELATQFNTRDSSQIIDALATLQVASTRRLKDGMAQEEMLDELDSHVTRIMSQVFGQGVALAKLVDPSLRGGVKVDVNVGRGGQAAVAVGNPNALMAEVVRTLEKQGIPRADITPDMVTMVLGQMTQKTKTIEGTVVEEKSA